ncbi:adenosylcobinamide-GDP ribazoletransferase [Serinicoccus kebangsaanensis]|uniref:adenosylcobinamide-GDP ribazoletransferase n=1 Tax=Serinicoccus kebangsaanensis TaxID=2602069 RepID=UPI00124F3760|nr:adenosylcobinamide-GDP ribazoletransferase [Serinicoccus kebangsaanensis]
MLAGLRDATTFLTRLPLPAREGFDLARAAWALPVVGAVVGAATGLTAWAGVFLLPPLVAATLAVLVEVLLTGALHLDGLADCADGCGGRDRESRLAIMKDHATGVYGATAVVLALLLHVAALGGLLAVLDGWQLVVLTAAAGAVSRTVVPVLAHALPYARAAGTAGAFVAGLTGRRVVAAVASGAVAALVAALLLGPGTGIALVAAGALAVLSVGWWSRRTLGGVTGDVLGAAAEVTRLACLVAVLATL